MFMVSFLSWWYKTGWAQVASSFDTRITHVANSFSVSQLFKTLFAPWRRIISYPGASLGDKFRAWGDNLFSRTIGLIVRLLVLIAAGLTIGLVSILTLIELVLWPILPPAVIGLIILGIVL
jgi:hypothetical protein